MSETNGSVSIQRLTVPIMLVIGAIIGSIGAAALHWDSLARISSLEKSRDRVETSRYTWRRRDHFTWCLLTERLNPGWSCWDPYMMPTGESDIGPVDYLTHDVNRRNKTDREKMR